LLRGREVVLFVNQQDQWQFEQRTRMNLRTPLAVDDRDRDVDFSCLQQSLGIGPRCLVKLESENRKASANPS